MFPSYELSRPRRLLALALVAAATVTAAAAAPPARASAPCGSLVFGGVGQINLDPSCFESGDGNMTAATVAGGTDWSSFLASGASTLSSSYVTHDATGGTDDTFVSGKKEEDPANWAFNQSPSSPKDDLLAAAKADDLVSGHVFAYLGATRVGNSGSMDLSFEFNQEEQPGTLEVPTTFTDGSGTHQTTTLMPARQTGDVLIAFDTNGSVVTIGGCIWKGTSTNGAWYLLPTGAGTPPAETVPPSSDPRIGTIALDDNTNPFGKACTPLSSAVNPAALGAVNTAAIGAGDNVLDGTDLADNQFAELSVDLTLALTNPQNTSPCFHFGSVWMRTRSSNQVSSTPEDLVAPRPLNASSCTVSGTKYLDANGNGTRDSGEGALAGFKFQLQKNTGGSWTNVATAVSDSNGHYAFNDLPQGDYRVIELGYFTSPADATGTFHSYASGPYVCTEPAETAGSCVSGTLTLDTDNLNRIQDFGNHVPPAVVTVHKTEGGLLPLTRTWDFTLAPQGGAAGAVVHPDATTGDVSFPAVAPGDYTLCEINIPAGWETTLGTITDGSACQNVTLTPGQQLTVNADNGRPHLALTKSAVAFVYHGDTITYSFSVTNDGNVPLTAVSVHDTMCPTDPQVGNLAVGATAVVTCDVPVAAHDAAEANPIHNVAQALGTSPGENPVTSNQATADVRILHPAVSIDKSGPATATAGDLVTYTLIATNTGDEAFAAPLVVVSDARCEAPPVLGSVNGDATPDSFDPGDHWTYSCSVQTAQGDTLIHNVADVDATDPNGRHATASDDADTTLTPPIVVLPETIKVANAKLRGPEGCVSTKRTSQVVVTGKRIASATFYVGGRKVKTQSKAVGGKFSLALKGKRLSYGSHGITVRIQFLPNSTLKSKTLRLRVNRCRPVVLPTFTG